MFNEYSPLPIKQPHSYKFPMTDKSCETKNKISDICLNKKDHNKHENITDHLNKLSKNLNYNSGLIDHSNKDQLSTRILFSVGADNKNGMSLYINS